MAEVHTATSVGRITAVAVTTQREIDQIVAGLSARGYATTITPHLIVCQQPTASGQSLILHTFNERTVDEDLAGIVGEELGPVVVATERDLGDAPHAILGSACPGHSPLERWRQYSLNTLVRLRALLDQRSVDVGTQPHIAQFAAIYRQVLRHMVGESLLDVGTSPGFLPILAAERSPGLRVVGCDVRFLAWDMLKPGFRQLGDFDTVTAIHLLEHMSEEQMLTATANLLKVAARRLIVAVP